MTLKSIVKLHIGGFEPLESWFDLLDLWTCQMNRYIRSPKNTYVDWWGQSFGTIDSRDAMFGQPRTDPLIDEQLPCDDASILLYWCNSLPVYCFTGTLLYWWNGILVHHYTGIQLYQHTGRSVYRTPDILILIYLYTIPVYWYEVYQYIGILVCRYTCISVYQSTCILVYWYTGVPV